MPDRLGLAVVSRVAPPDRLPFVKALAHLATVDDRVTLDEKKAVLTLAKAWGMSDAELGEARDVLRSTEPTSLPDLVAAFSESHTPLLLLQELVRLSHADGAYAEVERREIHRVADDLGLSSEVLAGIEAKVERGSVWEADALDPDTAEELARILGEDDDTEPAGSQADDEA